MTKFLTKREVAERLGYHPESITRMAREGRFPQPVRLAANKSAFVEVEVETWVKAQMAARDDAPGCPQ